MASIADRLERLAAAEAANAELREMVAILAARVAVLESQRTTVVIPIVAPYVPTPAPVYPYISPTWWQNPVTTTTTSITGWVPDAPMLINATADVGT